MSMTATQGEHAMSEAAGQTEEHVFLHSTVGGSDKVYPVWLKQEGDGWVVNFQYGRRLGTLKPGTKTSKGPVSYEAAKKIYDKVVSGQMSEGYKVIGGDAPVYVMAAQGQKQHSGVNCQLLTAIDEEGALALNRDPSFFAQEKHDGVRMLLERRGEDVRAINRTGIYVGFPEVFRDAALTLQGDFLIDGEAVGEQFRAFDILERGGKDLRAVPSEERLRHLAALLRGLDSQAVVMVDTAFTTEAKTRLHDRLQASDREGIVYKHVGSPYEAGRAKNAASATQLKRKFYETCSAVAGPVNDKRSVPLRLFEDGMWVGVGNCTIPPNHKVPAEGVVVEVRYLYAYRGGSLVQPSYLGPRTDIDASECTTAQLKFKSAEEIAALQAADSDPAPSGPRF
jgi:bifunctional non-homologous end joining protein LigD